jgi:hypothetical protein
MSIQNSIGTAVVTGASSGIGAVYAGRFAQRGYDLLLIARDGKRLADLSSTISGKTGRKVVALSADLTNKPELLKVEDRIRSDKSISVLVNNAGFGGTKSLVDSSIDDLENMIALNVTALTRLKAAVLPSMIEQKSGAVINIASVVALNPEALNGTYSGSKAYVVNFTQALFETLKDTWVQAQAVPRVSDTRNPLDFHRGDRSHYGPVCRCGKSSSVPGAQKIAESAAALRRRIHMDAAQPDIIGEP